ncbi:hypothetical protein [Novosphingobium sp. MD-1]|uniref:hypothetical protein n=1 Tax=Novosphingobium sp. MD-1 TaxID=1630648 RepID=UPI00061BC731|nr:hypothetical protein [Novosphingobium sp. MD-1]GAO54251.1 hypothetical protein NMD1_01346 [Novosphingobium sp. MD-1]
MTRFLPRITALALIATAGIAASQPVQAQDATSGEKVNQLIIYGDDPCPASNAGEITVCARKDESERFRIPAPLRDNPNAAANQGWTERVRAYETVGAAGVNSCSPVGSGGASGCVSRLINAAYAEKKQSSDVQFGRLIEEERAKRLQTIDADTAAEQARVEVLEKQYEEKLAKERAAEDAAGAATPPPAITPSHP